ncbi:hypothetical protein MKW98_029237 [Papaver atlanticum]|uniref:Glycosyltransferase n=1 Tax=Papaver atlanticum TaxID=357466 RepID=A0AAD4T3T9_9MAGN|nr:hypothetical protein MKW98_029237 [Papaver atlanticum]
MGSPASSLSTKPKSHHVVIFPFMSQGHTLPLLDLSKSLSTLNLTVTIITTPANALQIQRSISRYPNIHLRQIPFPPIQELPTPCENTNDLPSMSYLPQFFTATTELQEPFDQVLQDMKDSGSLPLCVISDFFLGFTLGTCRKFNVPRVVFHGMGVLSMVIAKYFIMHASDHHIMNSGSQESVQLPGLTLPFSLTKVDIPEAFFHLSDPDNPMIQFYDELGESETNSWGVIVNSFVELENEQVGNLESFYKQEGAKAWCVGPLFLYHDDLDGEVESDETIKWLDEHEDGSVVYVSFGTQAEVSNLQLDEIIHGLEMSNHPFIFVVRSKTWILPDGLEGKVKGKGLVAREWVNQRRILSHKAIGGFLSHCGWNSVLESISFRVPILVWPMMAEQPLNARIVVDGFGIGLEVPRGGTISKVGDEIVAVGRGDICKGVNELMNSEQGMRAREKVKNLGEVAEQAVQKDGSSYKCLTEFIDALTKVAN